MKEHSNLDGKSFLIGMILLTCVERAPFNADEVWIEDDGDKSDSSRNNQTYNDTPTRENSITRDSISNQRNKRKALASTATSPLKKIKGKKKNMEDAISNMDNSVDLYFSSKSKEMGIDEVYDVVSVIPELGQSIFFKVCNWFMEDEKKFQFLKKLPKDMRKNYVLESMPNGGN